MALNNKQEAFVQAYLRTFNATRAAKEAGYSEKTARQIGSQNLSKIDIQQAIQARIKEMTMDADEVLIRLAKQARASMEDFVRVLPGLKIPMIDWEAAQAAGAIDGLKKITIEEGKITFELYDKQAALVHIGKHLGLFTDRLDVTSADERIGLTINIGSSTEPSE